MKRAQMLTAIFVLVAISGCEWPLGLSRNTQPQYQLISATDGKVFRLDLQTGAVHYITPERMVSLSNGLPVLRVGEYYQMSDAKDDTKYLKYLGNGQFEKSQWAVQKKP